MKKSELRKIIREELEHTLISEDAKDDLKAIAKLGIKGQVKKAAQGMGAWIIGTHADHIIQIKRFDEPSEGYGLNGGRISKLFIKDKNNDQVLVNFDRGWDEKPNTPELKKLVAQLAKAFQ